MSLSLRKGLGLGLVLWGCISGIQLPAAEIPKAQLDFFESKIRPLLAENCYKCHSPSQVQGKVKGGLELDWKGGWEKGGIDGEVIKPGDPEASLLIKAVRYGDPDLAMPPKTQLSPEQVADLVRWVRMGAPDPRTERPKAENPAYASKGKEHWAFKPVTNPAPPPVKDPQWGRNEIDKFVLAKLEAAGMKPNGPADKRTLIRRAYFDLIGLPPTPDQVYAFILDESPEAFDKVVDSLLASPQYGERWGRHWLDVARYSDTKGQPNRRLESPIYPYAWTYRDYVISSFNADKPYDQFIREQLAGDKLRTGTNNNDSLAALGFLTLGDRFNGNMNDQINDVIDVTTKGFLGLTVSCARCHDHKFDPIPQVDYYSLRGIFASTVEPRERPIISNVTTNDSYQDYLTKRGETDLKMEKARVENMTKAFGDYKKLAGVYLWATRLQGEKRDAYLKEAGADPAIFKNWEQISTAGGAPLASILGVWYNLARIPEGQFAATAKRQLAVLGTAQRAVPLNPYVIQAFRGASPSSLNDVAKMYGQLFASEDPVWETMMLVSMSDAVYRFIPNMDRNRFQTLRDESDALELAHPGTPPRAMAVEDVPNPQDSPLFVRGEPQNRGGLVPRRFLEVLSGPNRPTFQSGSGRLELADAIANPNNPLTARVMANRVWQHHFGEGLVATPDDLGNQSAPASHPELLDYLATTFVKQGWSLKKLHKLILTSATYRQSSAANLTNAEKDPYNRLLWRANVRRLEFEPLRDSFLAIGGSLDLTLGGHPVDLSEGTRRGNGRGGSAVTQLEEYRVQGTSRRTIYGYINRSDVADLLTTFDFASPDIPTGKRYETTVPQQALFLMNSPLVIEQVRRVVNRDDFKAQTSDEARLRYLYELFFSRFPSPEEVKLGVEFVEQFRPQAVRGATARAGRAAAAANPVAARAGARGDAPRRGGAAPPKPLDGWQEFAHALLMTNEAMFVN